MTIEDNKKKDPQETTGWPTDVTFQYQDKRSFSKIKKNPSKHDIALFKTYLSIPKIRGDIYPKIKAIFLKFLIILFWSLSAVVLFLPDGAIPYFPGGIICQVSKIPTEFKKRISESPYGRLCTACDHPATRRIKYSGPPDEYHYFCDSCCSPYCIPEVITSRFYSFPIHVVLILFLYGSNFIRIIVHVISRCNKFKFTYFGALFIFLGTMIYWMSFSLQRLTVNSLFAIIIIMVIVMATLQSLKNANII